MLPSAWLIRARCRGSSTGFLPAIISTTVFLAPLIYSIICAFFLHDQAVPRLLYMRLLWITLFSWCVGSTGMLVSLFTARTIMATIRAEVEEVSRIIWPRPICWAYWYLYWLMFVVLGGLLITCKW
jgi:hypothetical protein